MKMQDIDFDELDRAVSSVTKPNDKGSESVSVTVNTSAPSSPSLSSASSPAARRSSGRFMDVVHPSSDMRSATSDVPERSAPVEPERSAVPERSEEPETPARSFEWPDPIDVPGTHSELKTEEAAPAEAEPEEEKAAKPLESPFLNDTKVEKRPLGAFSDTTPEPDTSLLVDEEPAPEPEKPKQEEKSAELETEALIEEAKAVEPEPAAETPAEKPAEAPAPEPAPAGPTSITQQYKEQPSTADQPSGAIFDTENYHKALAHPVKKRSGALVIVWIVALIVVGGGVGAAVYFFVLPML